MTAAAQDRPAVEEARDRFLKGDHDGSLEILRDSPASRNELPAQTALEIRILLETGEYQEAVQRGITRWRRARFDPELNLELSRALRSVGEADQAAGLVEHALQFLPETPRAGQSRETVAFAEILLDRKADAKAVLDRLLVPAKKVDPESRAAYLAIGRLALANHDRELAAENFREGLKRFPGDPEFALGLERSGLALPREARAEGVESYLDLALKSKPRYPEALLLRAEQRAGRKDFQGAREALDQVFAINPDHPEAWAWVAAIELLQENPEAAEKALARARKFHEANPRIPEIVGVALASQYRFAEGIEFLQQAAGLDPDSPSILFELGSNQLRFGMMEEGWKNVEQAHDLDAYHVAAFNLITLRDKIEGYPVREQDGVQVRMSPEDMAVFGGRALELAVRAKRTLAEKYGFTLSGPVMVEMLPQQEDFAIRTFGLPGGESFLGVCFGPLITMTSPRGRLGRSNWEAVLWHEMAHTITLGASRHRIPRWLSEGISVHEERMVREGWGMGMNSDFRKRILDDEMPPIPRLDELFAGADIQFGYFHSSLVAEFLVERFGIEAMRAILSDLSAGKPPEQALEAHTLPLDRLEEEFRKEARKQAQAYGAELDWEPLSDEEYVAYRDDPAAWVAAHPSRYAAAMMWISTLSDEGRWQEARPLIERIIAAEPDNREDFNPYRSLALACRGLDDAEGERQALSRLLELDANDSAAASRLLEIEPSRASAERMLETNPFQESAYREIARSSLESGDRPVARDAWFSLLALEPRDSSRLHYELAGILLEEDRNLARVQVLKALEENPRFQAALRFLVNLSDPSPTSP